MAYSWLRRRLWGDVEEDGSVAAETSRWSVRAFTARRYAEIVDRLLHKATPVIGDYLYSYLSDEPATADEHWQETWPGIKADLHAKLRRKLGVAESEEFRRIKGLRLRHWALAAPAPCPRRGWPRPWTWLRAKLLHALFPAEEDASSRATLCFVLLNCSVWGQVCNWVNLARFAMIDRTDEYQLVEFIIANKGYHFVVYGLIQLFQNLFEYFECVLYDVGWQHPCSDNAPGRHVGYELEFVMEMARMGTALWAFWLLRGSKGGQDHIVELERKRLGLREDSHTAILLCSALRGAQSAEEARAAAEPTAGPVAKPATEPAERGADAERAEVRGGMLRYLLLFDVSCWLLCYSLGFINAMFALAGTDCTALDCRQFKHHHEHLFWAQDPWPVFLRDWRFWMTLDFSQTTYSLLLLPYTFLALRPVRKYLLRAKDTGYDRAGRLCAMLTWEEKELRAEAALAEAVHAASRIQSWARGARARAKAGQAQAQARDRATPLDGTKSLELV